MFTPIDYESWDRKEIYDLFHGYLYCMTVELDITEFISHIHEHHWKFYPAMCYCIAKTVNEHQDYRYAKINGQIGYFEDVNPHYTLLRTNSNHLFTHQWTSYCEDFSVFHEQFMEDKALAEAGDTLYYPKEDKQNSVHISIMPNTTYTALSYSKPDSFTHYNTPTVSYIPFVMIGKYHTVDGRVKIPITTEFHHAVNDGYHAEQFFHLLEECCRTLA